MTTKSPMHITRLVEPRVGSISLREIYHDSFPPHERMGFSSLVASIVSGLRWLYTATDHDQLIGFAIIIPHIAADVHLLEYLAVARDARNGGIGGKLLDHLVETIRAEQNISGILLEVESDDEDQPNEKAMRQRRIGFYQRHGARLIDCAPHYRAPIGETDASIPMKLLWLPLDSAIETPRGDKLRECVIGIYTKSYNIARETKTLFDVLNQLDC